jgi:hypothetical protein
VGIVGSTPRTRSAVGVTRPLIVVGVVTVVGVGLVVSFAMGFITGAHRNVGLEFCLVTPAAADPGEPDEAGELRWADPGSGCAADEVRVCGTYTGRKDLDVDERAFTAASCP